MHKHHAGRCAAHGHDSCNHHHEFKHPFGLGGNPHGFAAHAMRARRGDVRSAVLRLLAEEPMHGYQIIQELSARSDGAWSPSAGSVYPTLQLLADEGLVSAEETGGKRVFSLTEAGIAAVAEIADQPAPWESATQGDSGASAYREAAGKVVQAVFQIGKSGTAEQRTAAVEVLVDARKKLYDILGEK